VPSILPSVSPAACPKNATYNLVDQWCIVINNRLMGSIGERIGWNIRIIREQQGLSQEELGAIARLHRAYIGQIERGEKNIGLKNLEKIANALNVNVSVLVDSPRIDE
jgi:ribosome-binding protein aMBF1 (putative translation factor)